MKTTITFFLLTFCLCFFTKGSAQMSFMTSADYGQVFDVTYDPMRPNVMYAHTVTNHIVKSSDNGISWEIAYSFPLNLNFGILKELRWTADQKYLSFIVKAEGSIYNQVMIFDPATDAIIKTFPSPNGNKSGNLIASYSVTGENHENILLHTTYMGPNFGLVTDVFYSNTGGNSWTNVYTSSAHDGVHVNNVAIFPTNPAKIFIARGVSPGSVIGGLFVSEDSGTTWTEKNAGTTFSAIAFDPVNPQKMFLGTWHGAASQVENLYTSTDGGDNLNIIPITWTSSSTNVINKIVINPHNVDNIIILEANEIVLSKDGGVNWTNYVYPTNDVENKYYYGLNATFNPANNNEVIISSNYYPFRSMDGGVTLTRFKTPFANTTGRVALHKNTEKHLYYGLRKGFVHHNLQNGTISTAGFLPIGSFSTTSNNGLFVDPVVAGRVYVSNTRNTGASNLLVSTNHGANFAVAFSGVLLNLFQIQTSKQNPNTVWVSFGTMLRKFNMTPGNISSQEITLPSVGIVYGISIDDADENKVTVTSDVTVYKTTNGGQNWIASVTGLENLVEGTDLIYELTKNPFNKDQLLLSTTRGIYLSHDAGTTWNQIYNGSVMNKAEFSPYTNGLIVASSTYMGAGSGFTASQARIVYSDNFGQNWREVSPENLHYLFTESSAIHFLDADNAEIYFSTLDLGLIKYQINLQTLSADTNIRQRKDPVIYPNPASDYITIVSKEVREVSIVDFNGRTVLKTSGNKIHVGALSKGVYIVHMTLSNGKSVSKRIIKK